MKKTKKMLILCVFMCICLISTAVYAALRIEVKVNMSNIEFNPGDKLVITVGTNSVTGTTKGVFAVDGYVKYDRNIFEPLSVESFTVNGQVAFNPETCKFAIDLENEILDQDNLFIITLFIKENATPGEFAEAVSLEDIEMFTMDQGSCMVSTKLGIEVLGATEENNVNNENVPVENNTVENVPAENNTVENNTVENVPAENNTVENNTVDNNTVENTTDDNNTVENTTDNNTVENTTEGNTVENNTVDNNVGNNTNTVENNANTNVGSTDNTDNTTSNKILPATGKSTIMISSIVILIAVAYIFYEKYMRLRGIED